MFASYSDVETWIVELYSAIVVVETLIVETEDFEHKGVTAWGRTEQEAVPELLVVALLERVHDRWPVLQVVRLLQRVQEVRLERVHRAETQNGALGELLAQYTLTMLEVKTCRY